MTAKVEVQCKIVQSQEGEATIRNLASYLIFIGIFIIAIVGDWVILNYDYMFVYPRNTYILLSIGIVLVICAYAVNCITSYEEDESVHKRDNREWINKLWNARLKFGNWIAGVMIFSLVIAAYYDWFFAIQLLTVYFFAGIAAAGFLYTMQGERVEELDDTEYKPKTKRFLYLIDYRRHPFNISFILFILIVISFLLSKELGIPLNLEVGGNARRVASLPSITFHMSGLMLLSTFIYIINNGDIFGIRKAEQNEMKVMLVHFMEIITCGAALFIWILTVVGALI